ncbi:MAG: hypothetical protein M3O20_17950 [Acidobacteriota bacterium]|nr:hypothetical protein [Acidobacteriota bacterium]
MSLDRKELAENLLRLNGNAHWGHYVRALEAQYNRSAEALLNSDHPDEALRGECRAYLRLLKQIQTNNGTPT